MQDRELRDIGITRDEIGSVMVDDSGERIRAYPKAKAYPPVESRMTGQKA
jgi:hypothetical protein